METLKHALCHQQSLSVSTLPSLGFWETHSVWAPVKRAQCTVSVGPDEQGRVLETPVGPHFCHLDNGAIPVQQGRSAPWDGDLTVVYTGRRVSLPLSHLGSPGDPEGPAGPCVGLSFACMFLCVEIQL